MSVLYLGMRVASANLVFLATFCAPSRRADDARRAVLDLAGAVKTRREFLDGIQAFAQAQQLVLEMGWIERDELAFYLWDPADADAGTERHRLPTGPPGVRG